MRRVAALLAVLVAASAAAAPNKSPSRREGEIRIGPRSDVVVWLEGDDREAMAVRAARWDGTAWGPAETVSPAGDGSQLALAGATAPDGTPLVVWSGFDGRDDEIWWSSRATSGWATPARIAPDNSSPDILPSIAATPTGAIAAWSRYDGNDYRVVVARLRGGKWTAPATLGPAGSYHAALGVAANGRVALAFQSATGWEALELDPHGRPTGRRTAIERPPGDDERISIATADGKGITVRWRHAGSTTTASWR